jgi:serine/threonine-protein kinase ULK2
MIARKKLSDKLNLALNKEIDILKSITNPNIIRFHDVQKTNSNIYLILEYCSGGDLRQYLNERGRIEEFEVQKLIYHLSNGFKVFHERNIVHRDLKLSNLLLSSKEPNAVIKICDFGFARTVLESEEAKTFCGTPPNMAPEVLSK